jgi:hypothetical protein
LRQWKGVALALWAARKASIAARSCATELKLAPCSVVRARIENQISTWFSQLAWVGVKWTKMHQGFFAI